MNFRPLHVMLGFGLALLCVVLGVGWLSAAAVRMDRAEVEAKQRAVLEENVRLSLWRMDSIVAPLIASESARPYFTYRAFYPINRAYGNVLGPSADQDVLVASPLLKEVPKYIQLHFQSVQGGPFRSPQVPGRSGHGLSNEILSARIARLKRFRELVPKDELYATLKVGEREREQKPQQPQLAQLTPQQAVDDAQLNKSSLEWSARSKAFNTAVDNSNQFAIQSAQSYNPYAETAQERTPENFTANGQGGMSVFWLDKTLLLARSIRVGSRLYVQGSWLDWRAIQRTLLKEIKDLLPNAQLVPAETRATGARTLVSLPVRLVPGQSLSPVAASSSVKITLAVAWSAVLLAAFAFGGLLLGATSLSERRAIFVSAVTHELRTPLTTFRMYTEMLSEGMIKDEAKRGEYIEILRREGVRLGHLVENVLSYARLERGRAQANKERISTDSLIDRLVDRLEDRAMGADMELSLEGGRAAEVEVDVSVIEQILFNLVDNACKYASRAEDPRIHLSLSCDERSAIIRVSDHGGGVPSEERKRLFSPFLKSAQRAANSAPGVGLGLALSRRLARAMEGDLRYDPQGGVGGASFVLQLPLAKT